MEQRKTRRLGAVCCATAAIALLAGQAPAQTVSELEARIAKLEEENAKKGLVTSASGMDLTFYGYVRGDAYTDSTYDMGPNNLNFANITSASPENNRFGFHAFQTRLGVRGSAGDLKFNFEGDFYGGGGGAFRIRQAYGEYAGWTLGQTWSNWNADGNPATMVDFNGVPGGAGYRAMQIRYSHALAEGLTLSGSIEDDFASYKASPILTGALRYTDGKNIYKFTAMSRNIEDLSGDAVNGWGASISAIMKPWDGGTVTGVFVMGEGVSSLLNYGNGAGQQSGQATVKSTYDLDANGDPVGIKGYGIGVSQAISPKFEVGLSYGHYDYDDFAGAVATSVESISTGILTARYKPADNIMLAIEYTKIERQELGGATVDNDRLGLVAQFSF